MDLLVENLRRFHHHHMASIGKNLQFRTFDSTLKELGIFYRCELVVIATEDKRREINLLNFLHDVKLVTGQKIAIKDFRSTLQHIRDAFSN